MKTLVVWGSSKDGISNTRLILSNLRKNALDVRWEWEIPHNQDTDRHQIPLDCELVIILKDFMSHPQVENIFEQAKRRNIPTIRTAQRWGIISKELEAKGMFKEVPETRFVMAATPDKAPEALVVGGYLADRAEVFSRLIHSGWKVREHWLAGEGGHEYNKARNGIKMVVVLRDTLENRQYQQAHTLANLSRVPIIKWDVNRELFRRRLEQQGLLYEPLQMPGEAPPPEPPPPVPPSEQMAVDMSQYGPAPAVERRAITATAAVDSIVDILKPLADELHTNPLFNGVTIQVLDDGTVSILPIARKRIITTEGMIQPVVVAQIPEVVKPSPPPVPREPPPRPVVQLIPPKIEATAPKPTVLTKAARKGRGKGHLKGQKLNMDCRFPGCKARSLGPRAGFMCKAHQDIPIAQRKEYQKLFNATHVNP